MLDLLHPLINEADQLSPKVIEILLTRIIEPHKVLRTENSPIFGFIKFLKFNL